MRNELLTTAAFAALFLVADLHGQTFSNTSSFLGPFIFQTVAGDVNGDGRDDVVVRTLNAKVHVLLGTSDGRLADAVTGPAMPLIDAFLGEPRAVMGDVNGDGRSDLVIAGDASLGSSVFVQLGQSDGSFGAVVETVLPFVITDFELVDDDGDGSDDFWAVERIGSRVMRAASVGDGSFATSESFVVMPPGSLQIDFSVGDVDGDDELDVVIQTVDYVVSVAVGNSTDFDAPLPLLNFPNARTVGLADITADGVLDIAARSVVDDSFMMLTGGPDVLTTSLVEVDVGVPVVRWTTADLDSNGLLDIVVSGGAYTAAAYQTSNAVFAAPAFTDGGSAQLNLVDIDLDGRLDLIRSVNRAVRVLHGERNGTFGQELSRAFAFELATGHLNGDDLLDVVSVESFVAGAPDLSIRLNEPLGGWEAPQVTVLAETVRGLGVGNVNGDGADDIVVVIDEIRTLLNDGTANFTEVTLPGVDARRGAAVVDLTGDGILDVVGVSLAGDTTLYTGLSDGTYSTSSLGPSPTNVLAHTAGDVDGDGIDELISAGFGVTLVDPTGITVIDTFDPPSTLVAVALVDLDLDNDLDLLVANGFDPEIAVWINAGGTFTPGPVTATTYNVHGLATFDADGDGDDDVVASESSGVSFASQVSVWFVDGSGHLTAGPVTSVGDALGAVRSFDIDGDGVDDIMVEQGDHVVSYANTAGSWMNLGESLAGSSGRSGLDGFGALTSGGEIAFVVDRSLPLANTSLVLGFSELGAPFAGGTLVPNPDVILGGLVTDLSGDLEILATLPSGVPAGIELYFQAWQQDPAGGFSATTALLGTTR